MISQLLRKLFFAVTFLCLIFNAGAQQLEFEHFTTANALPADRMYNLYMDHKGYIWACGNFGIVKYNGNTFVPVCTNIEFKDRFAYCMFQNEKGEMWFASAHEHIFKIEGDSAIQIKGFEKFSDMLHTKGADINKIIVDDDGNIFLSTTVAHAYELVKKEGYRIVDLNTFYNAYGKDSTDLTIIEAKQQTLVVKKYPGWPVVNAHTYKVMNGNRVMAEGTIQLKDNSIVRLAEQFGNALYISAGSEFVKIAADGSTRHTIFQHTVIEYTADNEGNIWIGTLDDGLYKVNEKGAICDHYFPGVTINCVLFDDQSGVWVSSGMGVFHCKNIHDYSFSNFPELSIVGSCTKIDSTLFVGSGNGTLYRIRKNGIPERIELQHKVSDLVKDIVKSPDGKSYYIGCRDGVLQADTAFKNIKFLFAVKQQKTTAVALLYSKKQELYSITRKSLCTIKDNVTEIGLIPTKAYSFINYENGGFLIGAGNGLYVYAHDSIFTPAYLNAFKDICVLHLTKAANGNTWIGTIHSGLFCLRPDHSIISYPKMPGDVINNIFFLNDTTIGMSMNTGLYITTLSKLNDIKSWYRIINEETNEPCIFNNKLYADISSGLICFNLDKLQKRNNSKLYFTKAMADSTTYYQLPLVFRHDQNKLEFYFDLLDYTTSKVKLYYKLEGNICESGTVEGTQIILRQLPPGKYTLTVRSAVSLFYTNEKAITVSFVIEPAFWQTAWFLVSIIVLALLIIVSIVYFINLRTRNRERQKAQVTRMLAEHKLTALKAQINPHFISNSLSAIQQLIMNNKTDEAGLYLSKFSLLIRHVLKYSDEAVVKLSDELEVMDLNIQLESLRFKDDFKMEKNIDPAIDATDVDVPPLIMQPFIENAIWHGLLPLKGSRAPRLTVSVSRTGADLLICIEDNGVGRSIEKKPGHESRGTQLIYNRLENINLMLGTKTALLKIDDLFDDAGNACGTRVSIVVPGKLNHTEYDEN